MVIDSNSHERGPALRSSERPGRCHAMQLGVRAGGQKHVHLEAAVWLAVEICAEGRAAGLRDHHAWRGFAVSCWCAPTGQARLPWCNVHVGVRAMILGIRHYMGEWVSG